MEPITYDVIRINPSLLSAFYSKEEVLLQCTACSSIYLRRKQSIYISVFIKNAKANFCSRECQTQFYNKTILVKCAQCGTTFKRLQVNIKKTKNCFCSRSCAAIYNNKNRAKRMLKGSCFKCGKKIHKCNKYCIDCRPPRKVTANLTLEQHKNTKGFKCNHFTGIRDHARRIAQRFGILNKCSICGYDKHVVACHIKPIKDFSLETKISEINDLTNLIGLCPNHHWELDHGILKI